jgi:hypothetical protein
MRHTTVWAVAVLAGALVGCGEKPQTAQGTRKSDTAAFQGGEARYAAPGWTTGDKASWEQQLRTRAQAQNEYARTQRQP